jgi:glycosyltransferase involved in cell wall biosynthesis
LRKLRAGVFVSTAALAKKYGLPETAVLGPLPLQCGPREALESEPSDGTVTVFYHGTASHRREIVWLRDMMGAVLERYPQVEFEIFGGEDVQLLYAGLERVRVVYPLNWQSFLNYSSSVRYDIGLAPLLESPFNDCRSHVKYYDISRTGAVGVYSDVPAFRSVINHDENGLLVPNSQQAWVDVVCALVEDKGKRQRLMKGVDSTMEVHSCVLEGRR